MNWLDSLKLWWYNVRGEINKYPISNSEIEKLVNKRIKPKYFECLDGGYAATDRETILKYLKFMPIAGQKYIGEDHDCENFAMEFMALAKRIFPRLTVGYVHVQTPAGLHAANIIFYKTDKGRLTYEFIEPQDNKMFMPNWKIYLLLI